MTLLLQPARMSGEVFLARPDRNPSSMIRAVSQYQEFIKENGLILAAVASNT